MVRVEGGAVVHEETRLICPPRREFVFTHIHGIRWEDVRTAPTFGELWPEIAPLFRGVPVLAAHNASFDRGVLAGCCEAAGITPPPVPFLCTVRLARSVWQIRPTSLSNVCRRLEIPLNHHEAGSDSRACAEIVLRALQKTTTQTQRWE
jgi:DNA polymerase-3 subunit epsilon